MGWSTNGNAERKLRERLKAEGRPCYLCGQPIDYSLPKNHPMAFQLDHIVPRAKGGAVYDYNNAGATHRACNLRKGAKTLQKAKQGAVVRTRNF